MAKDGVAVNAELAGLVARVVAGDRVNVAAQCRELGVSRGMFYKYLHRFEAEGVDGFFPRTRAPARQAGQVSAAVEDAVVLARKTLAEDGLDHGAQSVLWWLQDHPQRWQPAPPVEPWPVPSRATIHRILVRRGHVVAVPARRPRRGRRFVRPAGNDLWQMDGYDYVLADGTVCTIIEAIDDHSRLLVAAHAATSENGPAAWEAFCAAASQYGLPYQLLTDNGAAFSGRRRGWTSQLESHLHDLGVATICASVGHPQTCGKVERLHATGQRWLDARPPATDLGQLQQLLDDYQQIYNTRRHQALAGLTPEHAWKIAPRSGPAGQPLPHPLHVTTGKVSASGGIRCEAHLIGVGRRYAGSTATLFRTGDHVSIFIADHLARELTLNRNQRYQPRD